MCNYLQEVKNEYPLSLKIPSYIYVGNDCPTILKIRSPLPEL